MKSTVTDILREFQKLIPTRPQYLNFFGHMLSIFDRYSSLRLNLSHIMFKLAKDLFNRFLFFVTFLIVPSISSVSKYPFLRKKDEAQLRIRKSRK